MKMISFNILLKSILIRIFFLKNYFLNVIKINNLRKDINTQLIIIIDSYNNTKYKLWSISFWIIAVKKISSRETLFQ